MTNPDDLCERLEAKRFVREEWVEPHGTMDVPCDADDSGAEPVLRNPDGPEAAALIRQLRRENEALREAWIVVNIGCIECGVSSNIVGVFTDEAKAKECAERLHETHNWREGGQNDFVVFPMPPLDVIADEYTALPQGERG